VGDEMVTVSGEWSARLMSIELRWENDGLADEHFRTFERAEADFRRWIGLAPDSSPCVGVALPESSNQIHDCAVRSPTLMPTLIQ
jgi:hypothetical protein